MHRSTADAQDEAAPWAGWAGWAGRAGSTRKTVGVLVRACARVCVCVRARLRERAYLRVHEHARARTHARAPVGVHVEGRSGAGRADDDPAVVGAGVAEEREEVVAEVGGDLVARDWTASVDRFG